MIQEKNLIIRLITALYPKVKIYLFGSRARGTHTEISDIDLAVDIGRSLKTYELAQIKNIIQALNIPQTVDVVDLHSAPEELKKTIVKEGVEWKS